MRSDRDLFPAPPLSVMALCKAYGPKVVLDGVDLTIEPGTLTAVTGHNGSGKSTLLRCLAGLARYQGEVRIAGLPAAEGRHLVGYLPQSPGFPEWATVTEVIQFFARLRGVEPHATGPPPEFLPDGGAPVRSLSGGQAQRVALAVALLGSPMVLLLDEPAANLDGEGRASLWEMVEERMGGGTAVLLATPTGPDPDGPMGRVLRLVDGRTEEADSLHFPTWQVMS